MDKEKNLKEKMCKELIENGKVKENDVIRHSYTTSRINGEMKDIQENNISPTLDTRCDCLGVVVNDDPKVEYSEESLKRIKENVVEDEVSPTITANAMQSVNHQNCVLIKNNTEKGYLEAEEGDGINIGGRMEYQRGNVQKGMSQTLSTMGGQDVGVAIPSETNGLRIRKLTPKECCRLMGFEDKDYEAMREIGMTDSAIYHMCGDSIVVPVLMCIFSTMFEKSKKEEINSYINGVIGK